MNSIRRHLLLALLCAVLLGSLAGAWATWRGVREELDEIFDYNLRQLALSMRDMAYGVATALPLPDPEFDFVIQVWNAAGARLYYAHRHADPPGPARPGFTTANTSEGRWRVFAIATDGLLVLKQHVGLMLRDGDVRGIEIYSPALTHFCYIRTYVDLLDQFGLPDAVATRRPHGEALDHTLL